jgi:long-chain acyl-CoA synthetase
MNLASLAEQNLAEYGIYERLLFEGRAYTNRDLHEASCRLASGLVGLGCRTGDKVVLMMPNSPEVLITYPAVWRAGMIAVPVLFVLEARELAYILANSGARVVITSPDVAPKVEEATRALDVRVIVTRVGNDDAQAPARIPDAWLSFDALIEKSAPMDECVPREPDDPATLLYTSGTTGQPKGVVQTHRNLRANARNAWNSATVRRRDEVSLLVLPLAHTFGLSTLVAGYLFGGRGVLMRRFDPERALALIEQHKVTYMAGVPTMFVLMMRHPNAAKHDTSTVRRWLAGAAPMPVPQIAQFERTFGGGVYVGYGLSEASPSIAGDREGLPRKPGATGVPLEGVQVKIADDGGREVPRGTVGEICAKGENVSPGYYDSPEATAETFRDGWLFTGDMGYLDEEGYLFVVERKKDLVIRGGLNVYPKDVEDVILRHPAVLEAAVVGVPDARMGEEVCVFLVKRADAALGAEELIAHCQASLAKYKTPRYVAFVDALPRTGLGKIQKKEIRKLAAARFERTE